MAAPGAHYNLDLENRWGYRPERNAFAPSRRPEESAVPSPPMLLALNLPAVNLPAIVALAAVATIGYLVGRARRQAQAANEPRDRRDLRRARQVAAELEAVAESVRRALAVHHASLVRFKQRVGQLSRADQEVAWKQLCAESEEMLKPTTRLAGELSHAYDSIRQQTGHLMSFAEVRTDPLTGVHNRRGLEETLASLFAMMHRYEQSFSLAIVDVDHFKRINDNHGHLHGDHLLQEVANLLDESVRDTDLVARYGGEEFVVVMPQTDLDGASVFTERFRRAVAERLGIHVSGGVAMVLDGDSADSLMSRADTALYSAKAAGRNRVYRHTGIDTEPVAGEDDVSLPLARQSVVQPAEA